MKHLFLLPFVCILGLPVARCQERLVYFAHNSAEVSPEGQEYLKRLQEEHRNEVGAWYIEGRTSAPGRATYNDSLSLRRADAVRKVLGTPAIKEHAFRLSGVGETLATPGTDAIYHRVAVIRFVPADPHKKETDTPSGDHKTASVTIKAIDAVSRQPITAKATLGREELPLTAGGYSVSVPVAGGLFIRFSAVGYRDSTFTILPSPTEQTVELLPEGVLQKLVFQNIYFYSNTADIVPESYRAMEQMLKQLQSRPGVRIQIRGHVNWPEPNPVTPQINRELQELSEMRAKAVMAWLIKKGIPAKDLSAVGLGFSQMVFPKANTEGQQAQNRRVEILLLK